VRDVELPEAAKPGQQVIVPRKGVLELQRILGNEESRSRFRSDPTIFASRSATFASLRS
jgi:DNA polymerase III sliding clamp (beta) subunit (PCNA family)